MRSFALLLIVLAGNIFGCASNQKAIKHIYTERELASVTKILYAPGNMFVPDNDNFTVHIVSIETSDSRPSSVSDDGQVIFLKINDVAQTPAYLRESAKKRLILLNE